MSLAYRKSMAVLDKFVPSKFQPFWNHPAGPKTVFFWAPAIKWGLVIAGVGDLTRPADQLSIAQTGALAATGCIWSRYSLVIIPKNYSLFSVNVFVAMTQLYQLYRAINYRQKHTVDQPTSDTKIIIQESNTDEKYNVDQPTSDTKIILESNTGEK